MIILQKDVQNITFYNEKEASKIIAKSEKLLAELRPYFPEVFLEYKVEIYSDPYSLMDAVVTLVYSGKKFTFWYDEYRKKYIINTTYDEYEYIDTGHLVWAEYNLTQPNNIGKLSATKIQAWLDYYLTVHRKLAKKNEENRTKIEAFKSALRQEPDINWLNDKKTAGCIIRGGLRYSFNIDKSSYSQKITLDTEVPITLETFKAMSDNNYNKTE